MSSSNVPGGSTSRAFDDPWDGPSKIVVGIDIGTTQSGVAFAFLQPEAKPTIHRVVQWPGQESHQTHGKIPTVLWYDTNNKAVSVGAEALTHQAEEAAEDGNWRKARYFKLHLHPPQLTAKHGLDLEPLPVGVSLEQVYSDFLGYLLQHTQAFFEDHIIDGKLIWQQYKPSMDIIIAHPNGWSVREQAFLRSVAVSAGLTSASAAGDRVHFINEAEASVHFCTLYSNIGTQLQPGNTFAVCDAGGSTVDTTVYAVKSLNPIRLEETRASDCVQAGAIFIDAAAEKYFRETFQKAKLLTEEVEEYAVRGTKDFENNAKRAFRDITVDQSVEIAGTRYNNPALRVRRGRMNLSGPTVKTFFDFCLNQILSSVASQLESTTVSHILLVGGFGESLFLREQVKSRFGPTGCKVTTTSEKASKAVADGTIIWYCSNSVVKRTPWYSYGIEVVVPHNPKEIAHRRRATVTWPSGLYSQGGWSQIVPKGVPVDCDTVSRRPYHREYSTPNPDLSNFETNIWSYTLPGFPAWMRFKPGSLMPGFAPVCSVKANLNNLRGALEVRNHSGGGRYWYLSFNVCIHFGRTEYRAYLEWVENFDMSVEQTDGVLDIPFNSSQNNPQDVIEPDTELPSSTPTQGTHRPTQKETCVLVLGPTGSGKSSLINLVTGGNLPVGSPGSGPCTTECRFAKQVIGDQTFRLIDSPGWDTSSRRNISQFKHLIDYLARIRASVPAQITGVLCLHPQGSNLECNQLRRVLEAIRQLLGETWLPHITIAVVGNNPSSNSDAVQTLQNPASPFHSLYTGGSKIRQLTLQPRAIEEILLEFNAVPSEEPSFYSKVVVRWRGRYPQVERDGLSKLIEQLFPPQQANSVNRASRRPPRPTLEESENARQQLQVALDSSEAELKSLRAQLEQTRLEYGSLRTELQLHDNTEQTKVVQSLKDLTRMIEDCSRAVAQHLVDDYVTTDLNASSNPDEVTALNAVNLVDLQAQFGLNGGRASLIATSTGIGMPIEDFFDMALRSIICRRLYQDIFLPFHPMINSTSDAAFMKFLYEGVRHHAPQSVAAKWRANSFIALTKGKGMEARKEMIEAQSHRIMADDISSLINGFFGHEKAIALHERHLENIKQIINSAWEWNDVLKGDIIMLGDFQPTYHESGKSFQSQYMVEFEGKRGGPPAEVVLCTIGLGLSLSHSKAQVENSGSVVVYKAKVVTECFYDR